MSQFGYQKKDFVRNAICGQLYVRVTLTIELPVLDFAIGDVCNRQLGCFFNLYRQTAPQVRCVLNGLINDYNTPYECLPVCSGLICGHALIVFLQQPGFWIMQLAHTCQACGDVFQHLQTSARLQTGFFAWETLITLQLLRKKKTHYIHYICIYNKNSIVVVVVVVALFFQSQTSHPFNSVGGRTDAQFDVVFLEVCGTKWASALQPCLPETPTSFPRVRENCCEPFAECCCSRLCLHPRAVK